MKNNSKDDSIPRAYIKEKYKNKILIDSYAPRPIPLKNIQDRIGKQAFINLGNYIDRSFNTH